MFENHPSKRIGDPKAKHAARWVPSLTCISCLTKLYLCQRDYDNTMRNADRTADGELIVFCHMCQEPHEKGGVAY